MESSDAPEKLNRRDFLKRSALLGASVGAAGLTASGCMTAHGAGKNEEPGAETTPENANPQARSEVDAGTLDCTDTTGLTPSEIKVRESLKYVDQTPKPEQDCANCIHWKPASGDGCGGCAIMAGPIHPKGWCVAWVVMR